MSKVYFISDLHLGHEGSLKWARNFRKGENAKEMNQWIIHQWNSVVTKRDVVYVLGDACMKVEDMPLFDQMQGTKHLIQGNHDVFDYGVYKKHFKTIRPYKKYKGFWLSHMPLDPYDIDNCRVRGNIHGHLHQNNTGKPQYHFNVSIEHHQAKPVVFEKILKHFEEHKCLRA